MDENKLNNENGDAPVEEEQSPPWSFGKKLFHALLWTGIIYGLWLLSVVVMKWATGQ